MDTSRPDAGAHASPAVLVIGGGLLGCAISYYLARAGVDVMLVEKRQLNSQASGRNAGSLHFQLEYRMIEHGLDSARKAAEALPLHLHAQHAWSTLATELQEDLGVIQHGGLMVAETAEQVTLLEQKSALEREAGLEVEMLDRDALRTLAPYLGPSILAAAFCPGKARPIPGAARWHSPGRDATRRPHPQRRPRAIPAAQRPRMARRHRRRRIDPGRRRRAGRGHLVRPYRADGRRDASRQRGGADDGGDRTAPFIKHLVQHAGRRLSMKQTQEGNVLIGGGWPAALAQTDGVVDLESQPELLLPSLAGSMNAAAAVAPDVGKLQVLRAWTGATALVADHCP